MSSTPRPYKTATTTGARRPGFLSRLTFPLASFSHALHDPNDPNDPKTMPSMSEFPELQAVLTANESWAKDTAENDPELLPTLAGGQKPGVLWIGCADSRVPETSVLGQKPGDVFVHRNIANQFHPDDVSANALLNYGVLHVGTKHVIVTGHTACGGCIAAHSLPSDTAAGDNPLFAFLGPLMKLRASLGPDATIEDLMVANVKQGVENVCKSAEAWGVGKDVYVHGWVYDIASGRCHDLGISQGPPASSASSSGASSA